MLFRLAAFNNTDFFRVPALALQYGFSLLPLLHSWFFCLFFGTLWGCLGDVLPCALGALWGALGRSEDDLGPFAPSNNMLFRLAAFNLRELALCYERHPESMRG